MGGRSKRQTVGYRYGLTLHLGICHGPVDAVTKIEVDERVAWSGTTAGGSLTISQPALFGGDEREGGLSGTLDIEMGGAAQVPNLKMSALLGAGIPAFRGILGLVWDGILSANNPYIKAWQITCRRVLAGWQSGVWYSAKAAIGSDMNPAHIIYQCLTDTRWGMGYPAGAINDGNFRAAADTLYSEGFGLSLLWNQQATIGAFVQTVLDHVGGSLRLNTQTGLFELKLIRADYDPGTLAVFGPDKISELQNYQRAGWGETINELTIGYTDPATRKDTALTVHDLANVQAQGAVISQKVNYPGICSHDIARRVAMRDLAAKGTPIAKVKLTVNRNAWSLLPGDVFKLSWPKLGISGLVMRVGSLNFGTLDNGLITVDAVEDVFGLPAASYAAQPAPTGWVNPVGDAAPSPARLWTEATYYDLVTTMTPADFAYVDPDDGYAVMAAQAPSGGGYDYQLQTRTGSNPFATVDSQQPTPVALLSSAAVREEHSIWAITAVGDLSSVQPGRYAVVGAEYVRIDGWDSGTGTLTVARGTLDTVPADHPAASRVFFADSQEAADPTAYPLGAVVDAKVITRTGAGALDPALAPVDSLTIAARHSLPMPPGKVRINGSYAPATITGEPVLTWAHRNRITQDSNLLAQDDADVSPEAGQTYTLNIYGNGAGAPSRTVTGLTTTTYTYADADEKSDHGGVLATTLRFELFSVRDGRESWQRQNFEVTR